MVELVRKPPADDGDDRAPAAVASAFFVALWFCRRAAQEGIALQPMKLQALLFLAQAGYAAQTAGRVLMPAVFVADERGPIEPNVECVLATGWLGEGTDMLIAPAIEVALEQIWRLFGLAQRPDALALAKSFPSFRQALRRAARRVVPLSAMAHSFVEWWQSTESASTAGVGRPRLLRTQTGRMVNVKAWNPTAATTDSGCE